MDKKEVLEQLVKGLKGIKEDMEKDMATEATKKVNTPAAMGALKAKAATAVAAPKPQYVPPPSNEATKKVPKPGMSKDHQDEKTKEESADKTVEKIAQGSKTTSDAASNLQDKDNYPKHTQDKAKKKGLTPFLLGRKAKEGK